MSSHRIVYQGAFLAKDGAGKDYTIHVYASVVGGEIREATSLHTTDGRRVDRLGKGRYEIRDRPTIPLHSDDPDAP